jgi:hypothetical protein
MYDVYVISIVYLCFCLIKTSTAMARQIKETPVLYGDDAKRFDERMRYNEMHKATEKEKQRIRKAYEYMVSITTK